MIDLGTLGGASSVVGRDGSQWLATTTGGLFPDNRQAMNEWGHVVGTSETADGESHAFLWRGGRMIDLGTLGGASSSAQAVNNWGQVVGISETADGETHGFLWQHGEMIDLGELAGASSSAVHDINDRGQIVGSVSGVPGQSSGSHAVMWTIR